MARPHMSDVICKSLNNSQSTVDCRWNCLAFSLWINLHNYLAKGKHLVFDFSGEMGKKTVFKGLTEIRNHPMRNCNILRRREGDKNKSKLNNKKVNMIDMF